MDRKSRPERMPGIELQHSGSDLLVHDTQNGKVHVLNVTAGKIFSLCDGQNAIGDIVDAIVAEWGVEPALAFADVSHQIEQFAEYKMIIPLR